MLHLKSLFLGKGIIARNPFRGKGQHTSCIKNTLLEPGFFYVYFTNRVLKINRKSVLGYQLCANLRLFGVHS